MFNCLILVARRVLGLASRVAALVFCMACASACSQSSIPENVPNDVLIVTIDTARSDRFSFVGPSPVTTRNTDAVAAEGAAFLAAVAPSPITLVSHASLFTGQNPFVHGIRNNGSFALRSEALTLAEVFAQKGWSTAAFIGAEVLDKRYGLDQGFNTYDDTIAATEATGMFTYPRRRGDEVVGDALRWLGGSIRGHTFVWVHLYDPHAPYNPPEPEKSRFEGHPYDGMIAYSDRLIGELLDGYRALGRYDRALVVITSDHGESLGEHSENTHGVFVYDATVLIPLAMRGPGIVPGKRVESTVGLVDIMPTVLDLAGIKIPLTVQGESLRPLWEKTAPTEFERDMYSESLLPWLSFGWSPLYGLRSGRWKYSRGAPIRGCDETGFASRPDA